LISRFTILVAKISFNTDFLFVSLKFGDFSFFSLKAGTKNNKNKLLHQN